MNDGTITQVAAPPKLTPKGSPPKQHNLTLAGSGAPLTPAFKAGDVVQLKCGGPPLMLEAVKGDSVGVFWIDDGGPRRATIPPSLLKAY